MMNKKTFFIFIFLLLSFFISKEIYLNSSYRNVARHTASLKSLEQIGLNHSQFSKFKKNIEAINKKSSDEFIISDTITSFLYGFYQFSSLGEFEISKDDIIRINETISEEDFQGKEYLSSLLKNARALKFGRKNGIFFVEFRTINSRPINLEISESLAAEDGTRPVVIQRLEIEDQARVYFEKVENTKSKKEFIKIFKKKSFLSKIPNDSLKQLTYIPKKLRESIVLNLNLNSDIAPLTLKLEKVSIHSSFPYPIKNQKLSVDSAYLIPGMTDGSERLSSSLFTLKNKFLSFTISIDQ